MVGYGIGLGILMVLGGLIFLLRPQTLFTTNPKKDLEKVKKYEASLTPKKILFIRIIWFLILILGAYIIYKSF